MRSAERRLATGDALHAVVVLVSVVLLLGAAAASAGDPVSTANRPFLFLAIAANLVGLAFLVVLPRVTRLSPAGPAAHAVDGVASLLPALVPTVTRFDQTPAATLIGSLWVLFVVGKGVALASQTFATGWDSRAGWRRTLVFTTSLIVYGLLGAWSFRASWPTGDEPHYLVTAESLAHGNLDLTDDYVAFARLLPDVQLLPHHTLATAAGEELPIHDVGLSALLVPGWVAGRLAGVSAELSLFAAALALGVFELSLAAGADARAALRGWSLLAFTPPLVVFASHIYPEVPAAAAAVWALLALRAWERDGRRGPLVAAALLCAALPWLSVRYWLVLGGMTAVVLWNALRTERTARRRASAAALLAGAFAGGATNALLGWWIYRLALPNAGYLLRTESGTSVFSGSFVYAGFGLLFDQGFGLLPFAPVYLLAFAGLVLAWRSAPLLARVLLAPIAVSHLFLATTRYWYGGATPPVRLWFVAAALLAPFASLVLERRPGLLVRLLAAWSLVVGFVFALAPQARVANVAQTAPLWRMVESLTGFQVAIVMPFLTLKRPVELLIALAWFAAAALAVRYIARTAAKDRPV